MITQEQFLSPLMEMTNDQMSEYLTKVQAYLTDTLPRIQFKTEWTEEDNAMFDEGLILISAFLRARDFCLAAYNFSTTEKRIKNILGYFTHIKTFLQGHGVIEKDTTSNTAGSYQPISPKADTAVIGASFIPPTRTGKQGRPTKPRNIPEIPSAGAKDSLLRSPDEDDPLRQSIAMRPRHLSDYIHLLPEALQTESLQIPDLYDQLADASHKLETLVNDPKSTQKDRAYHAALLCNVEDKLRNLWARIDAAYAEATGSTVSDDYKTFLETEKHKVSGEMKEKELCEYSKFDIDNMPEGEQRDKAKAARIERDKKFLRKDDRKTDGDHAQSHAQNLAEAATELHEWGIAITDSQVECCRKYGYEVPAEWIELPLEERKKQQAEARNTKRREQRAAARAERKAKKQAEIDEMKATYKSGDMSLYN